MRFSTHFSASLTGTIPEMFQTFKRNYHSAFALAINITIALPHVVYAECLDWLTIKKYDSTLQQLYTMDGLLRQNAKPFCKNNIFAFEKNKTLTVHPISIYDIKPIHYSSKDCIRNVNTANLVTFLDV